MADSPVRSIADDPQVAALLETKDSFFGHGLVRDPFPKLAELQAQCPVHQGSPPEYFGAQGPETVLYPGKAQVSVFDYDEIERAFKDPQTFSADWYQASLRASFGRTILEMDPPEHAAYRQMVQGAFTKKEMDRWEREFVQDLVHDAMDAIVPLGRADLVTFAIQYPLRVLVAACKLPQADTETYYGWAAQLTNVSLPEEVRVKVATEFADYLRGVIEERRRAPAGKDGTDLISHLVHARFRSAEEERGLTDQEVIDFLRLLLPAAAQTTYRTLCNLLYGLLTHPDQLAAVVADRSLIPQAIEEGLRWEPPLISFARRATVDTEIARCPVAAGTGVNLVVAVADRDPAIWPDPAEFDVFRPPHAHLAFGTGNHTCLGIHAARMELKVAMEIVFDRLPGLRLDPEATDVHISGLGMRSPDTLPVVFEPGVPRRSG